MAGVGKDSDSSQEDSDSFESCTEDEPIIVPTRGVVSRPRNDRSETAARHGQPTLASLSTPQSYAETVSGPEIKRDKGFFGPSTATYTSYASVTSTRVDRGQSPDLSTDTKQHQKIHGLNQGHHGRISDRPSHRESEQERRVPLYGDYHGETSRNTFGQFGVETEEAAYSPESSASYASYAAAASGRHEEERTFLPEHPGSAEATSGGAYGGVSEDWSQNEPGLGSYPEEEGAGGPRCICNHLMQSLQEWCRRTHGTNQQHDGDQANAVLELLDHLRNSFDELRMRQNIRGQSADPYADQLTLQKFRKPPVCPLHGFPGMSVQSRCTECAGQLNTLSTLLTGGVSDKTSPDEDKQTRKAITKANKSLARLNERVEAAIKDVEGDWNVDEMVTWMDAKKEEMERAMEEHVKRLHESIDFHHMIAREDFLKNHCNYKHQVLQSDEYRSQLRSIQNEIQEKFAKIKEQGLAAVNTIPDFLSESRTLLDNKPQMQVLARPEYSIEIQKTAEQDIASLVGRFQITEGGANAPTSVPSGPDKYQREEGGEKKEEEEEEDTESAARWSAVDQEDFSWSAPRGFAAPLNPYYPYMDEVKDASNSSLGNKDKHSAFMASTASVASSVGGAGDGARKKKRKKKKKSRSELDDLPYFSTERLHSKPRTLAVNTSIRPNMSIYKGSEPKSIAATKDGKLWAVFGVKNPELQLLKDNGKVSHACRVGGNAKGVACLDEDLVVLACHSPLVHLKTADREGNCTEVLNLTAAPTSVSVGKTGVVVSGHNSLLWAALPGWSKEWIVPIKASPLKNICATAVTYFNDNEFICAADSEGKAVHFYIKSENEGFSPMLPYWGPPASPGQDPADFVPISLAAHPESFLAILDSASNSVHVLNVEQSHQAVSVIPGRQLYRSNVPSLIALGYKDRSDEDLKLWVVTTSVAGACWISQTALRFQY